jgi:hypothetical protein
MAHRSLPEEKHVHRLTASISLISLSALALAACGYVSPPGPSTGTTATPRPSVAPTAGCRVRGVLPDPACTPGAANPAVTQANVHQTICVKGWTATVRPPVSYTAPLKVRSIRAYGYVDTDPRHYEFDHLIPLEVGGDPTAPANLWAEPTPTPNPKDRVEGALRQRVCSGRTTLRAAQAAIAIDWTTALSKT